MSIDNHNQTSPREAIAAEVLAASDGCRQIGLLTTRPGGLPLESAYGVTASVRRLREARGERVVGRKIGFTNTTIWDEYGVHAPIWGYMYDTTVHDLADLPAGFSVAHLAEPRIEPEIAFGLARAPEPGMDERELLECIAFVAHGFEIVQSPFPGWRFEAADTVAVNALHGAYLVGSKQGISAAKRDLWYDRLGRFEVLLRRNGADVDRGRASHVLGAGPLGALRHLVDVLANDAYNQPLAAGEVVTTGTLTRAFPVMAGETWSTQPLGLPLSGIEATFVKKG